MCSTLMYLEVLQQKSDTCNYRNSLNACLHLNPIVITGYLIAFQRAHWPHGAGVLIGKHMTKKLPS
jgi:hypothetical protein